MTSRPLQCIRCGTEYLQVNNFGRWECMQRAFDEDFTSDTFRPIPSEITERQIYIPADHCAREEDLIFTASDDWVFTVDLIRHVRNKVLSSKSLIPPVMICANEANGDRAHHLNTNGAIFGVRRFDYMTKLDLERDCVFRYGLSLLDPKPSSDDLVTEWKLHPSEGVVMFVKPKSQKNVYLDSLSSTIRDHQLELR